MKTATLFALICTTLDLLCQVFLFSCFHFFRSFWGGLSSSEATTILTTFNIVALLFEASLAYYFLALYKRQKS